MRHAAAVAGLGTITRNQLLTNRDLGNRLGLGAILTDADLVPDPVCEEPLCLPDCDVCREVCPAGAISDGGVNQELCRSVCDGPPGGRFHMVWCRTCREQCPLSKGE